MILNLLLTNTCNMDTVLDIIKNRRSCRHYTQQPIRQEIVELLSKSALWAPTSKNNRPWEFIWVSQAGLLQELSQCKPHGADFLGKCPLALVIAADPAQSDVWEEDCAIAATMVQLAAENLGLGSCWVQVRLRQHSPGLSSSAYCKTLLGIPDHYQVASIISLGYKARERSPYTDEQLLLQKLHYNNF
jgi:nitroreductase